MLTKPDPKRKHRVANSGQHIRVPPGTGDPVVLFTLGRSGTHLALDIMRRQFPSFSAWKWPGEPAHRLYLVPEHLASGHSPPARAARVLGRSPRPIVLTHQWDSVLPALAEVQPHLAQWLVERASVIYLLRDPRSVFPKMFAMFAMHRDQMSEDVSADPERFIAEQARRWVDHARARAAAPRALTLRFEALIDNPAGEVASIGAFLGEKPRMLAPLLIQPRRTRLDRVTSRLHPRPKSSHVILPRHARTAFPLDWTPGRLAILDEIAGEAMEAMGYDRPIPRAPARAVAATAT